ncbi:hypothetical protein [Clostridium sp.]|uniref:hypothetical protein n=1 Tax=Clostridium sp. TaxID=1506 RepID=UPI003F3D84BB
MKFKKYNKEKLVTLAFIILLAITGIYDFIFNNGEKLFRVALNAVTVGGCYLFYRKSFIKKSSISYYIILIFVFFSMYLASILNFYSIPHYDKYLHLASGAIIAILGYILYIYLFGADENKNINPWAPAIFVIIFAAAAAGIWEIWEFTTDSLFGLYAQNGLSDTMWDIICGSGVGVITAIPIYLHSKGKKIKIIEAMLNEMKSK